MPHRVPSTRASVASTTRIAGLPPASAPTESSFVPVGMNELSVGAEAGGSPAILVVDATLARVEGTRWGIKSPLAQSAQQLHERGRALKRGRLVRGANLERSEAWVRTDVPPEARVVLRHPGCRHPLDERLPLRVIAEGRGRPVPGQKAEHLGADRQHPRLAALEVR